MDWFFFIFFIILIVYIIFYEFIHIFICYPKKEKEKFKKNPESLASAIIVSLFRCSCRPRHQPSPCELLKPPFTSDPFFSLNRHFFCNTASYSPLFPLYRKVKFFWEVLIFLLLQELWAVPVPFSVKVLHIWLQSLIFPFNSLIIVLKGSFFFVLGLGPV